MKKLFFFMALLSISSLFAFGKTSETSVSVTNDETYNISLSGYPVTGGIVEGGGYDIPFGTVITISAFPHPYYFFLYWSEDDTIVSVDPIYSFPVTRDRNLIAHFSGCFYEITLLADPTEGGEVFGSGTYECETTVTVAAIPNPNYYFLYWSWNGVIVSVDSIYTFVVTEDRTFTAHFAGEGSGCFYDVTLLADPTEGGEVFGSGTYECGTVVTIEAIAAPGYSFVNWYIDGIAVVSADPIYTFIVNHDLTIVALFTGDGNGCFHNVTLLADPTEGGEVFGAGIYECETLVTIEATPNPDYFFVGWVENGVLVSVDTIYMFVVTQDRTLTAHVTGANLVLGIDKFENIGKIYPNPTSGELRIESGKSKINNIEIFDVYGRALLSDTSLHTYETTIDISHLPSGMYFVKIRTVAGEVVKKMLKE
jgi:hypothetical protein